MRESKSQLTCIFVTFGILLVSIIVLLALLLAEKSGHRIFSQAQRQERKMDKYTLDTFAKDLFFVWDDGHLKNYHQERKLCILDMDLNLTIEEDPRVPFDGIATCDYIKGVNETTIMRSEKYINEYKGYSMYFNVTSNGVYMLELESDAHYADFLNYGITIRQAFVYTDKTRLLAAHSFLSDFPQTVHMMISFKEGDVFFVECENHGVMFQQIIMKLFKLHS